jgi:hypothetical protein
LRANGREGQAQIKSSGRRPDALRHRTKNRRRPAKAQIWIRRIEACLPAGRAVAGGQEFLPPKPPVISFPLNYRHGLGILFLDFMIFLEKMFALRSIFSAS